MFPLNQRPPNQLAAHDVEHTVALDQSEYRRVFFLFSVLAIPACFRPNAPRMPPLVKRLMRADDHVHVFCRARKQGFERIGRQYIVAIHKRDPFAPRM